MKKIISLVLCACLSALLLASCGKNEFHIEENNAGAFQFGSLSATLYLWQGEDGGATLDIANEKGKTVQTLELPEQNEYYIKLSFDFAKAHITAADFDFDGYNDLYIPCSTVSPNLQGMCWLWNNDKNAFVLSDELSRLPELSSHPTEKYIESCERMSAAEPEYNYYEWLDGVLTLTDTVPASQMTETTDSGYFG